ncbi:two-component system alkaline phosphatase synthesis response regulator PhoP [Acholeplasma morum]|uniref:response regulator transcription factor n=1 Tax=Paracholeplasma morum TaxID=264637 RepID=UPI00195956F1|nr:response regulator transcription factor [Paracholeplasma morum]MBM7454045.1 two-component system alkaline phosphatase synthesis response regulator PhoP [Paracholeplasma morum]
MAIIYYLEDDQSIAYIIEKTLTNAKYETQGFTNGKDFFHAIEKQVPDLVLLDLMLPNESGLDHLVKLKNNPNTAHIPVIIVSALSSELHKVEGLDLGADDYLTKPFGVLELIARIQSKLRNQIKTNSLFFGNVSLQLSTREVFIDNVLIVLTYKEYELLKLFMESPLTVHSREQIFKAVWESDLILESRTIDMHIKSLRTKLQEGGADIKIVTVRSVGYRMINL